MYLKVSAKILLSIVLIATVYLAIVLAWASLSVEHLLREEAIVSEESILTPKQKDILLKIEVLLFMSMRVLIYLRGKD